VSGTTSRRLVHATWRRGAATVAVRLAFWLWPAAAPASCGDYLRPAVHPGAAMAPAPEALPLAPIAPLSGEPRTPCTGPHCSSVPQDVPQSPPPAPQAPDLWAVIAGAMHPVWPGGSSRWEGEDWPNPIQRGSPPDRPPR